MKAQCCDCPRWFDLTVEVEAHEYYYGHDCEPEA